MFLLLGGWRCGRITSYWDLLIETHNLRPNTKSILSDHIKKEGEFLVVFIL
jgi:hypothetical protein